jgi:hypothetical protein
VILGLTSIASAGDSAGPLQERLSAAGELSLEVWLVPVDATQSGPNPFISSSNRVDLRNFTLAQDAGNLFFWLRTPLTGLNGRKEELRTWHQPLTGELQHVVITYASRIATMYLDGVEQARLVLDRKQALLDVIIDGIGSDYGRGVRSALLFPFGVLSYLSFRTRHPLWTSMVPAMAGTGAIEATRALTLLRAVEASLVALSAGTVLVASIVALSLLASHAPISPLRTS